MRSFLRFAAWSGGGASSVARPSRPGTSGTVASALSKPVGSIGLALAGAFLGKNQLNSDMAGFLEGLLARTFVATRKECNCMRSRPCVLGNRDFTCPPWHEGLSGRCHEQLAI